MLNAAVSNFPALFVLTMVHLFCTKIQAPFASLDNSLNQEFIVSFHGPGTLLPLGSHKENVGSSEIREPD
jgi:hypothetical protein